MYTTLYCTTHYFSLQFVYLSGELLCLSLDLLNGGLDEEEEGRERCREEAEGMGTVKRQKVRRMVKCEATERAAIQHLQFQKHKVESTNCPVSQQQYRYDMLEGMPLFTVLFTIAFCSFPTSLDSCTV